MWPSGPRSRWAPSTGRHRRAASPGSWAARAWRLRWSCSLARGMAEEIEVLMRTDLGAGTQGARAYFTSSAGHAPHACAGGAGGRQGRALLGLLALEGL